TKAKVEILQSLGLRVCQYQEVEGSLAISDWDVIIIQVESTHRIKLHRRRSYVVILDEVNAIMRQISSGIHARESENALRDLLNETVKILYDPDKGSEAIRRGLKMLREGKHVAFAITSCKKAWALANQASALQKPDVSPILTRVYFGQMDGMQRQEDFTNINATWSSLNCVIYTSTVEAGISFEIPNHFDAIIGISNIKTGVHVKTFTQMLYRIQNCPQRIISLYNRDIGSKDDHRDWSIDNAKWINLCNTNFVKKLIIWNFYDILEDWLISEGKKELHNSLDPSSNDLRKAYLSKQWETIQKLFQILGFTGIDDERILSGSMVLEAFMQSCERFIEIRNQSLLLFRFKSRAKEIPDLKSAIKAINAIAGNWCGYTIKSDKKRIGPKGQQ
ncbi:457_t:CDS:2, partial [Funneliformis geosporum]